jgi:hypothetical protein
MTLRKIGPDISNIETFNAFCTYKTRRFCSTYTNGATPDGGPGRLEIGNLK